MMIWDINWGIGWDIGWGGALLLLVILAVASIRILREYERGVVFLLGRFWQVKGPGIVIIVPGIQQMVRVDLRLVVMDVPSQDAPALSSSSAAWWPRSAGAAA